MRYAVVPVLLFLSGLACHPHRLLVATSARDWIQNHSLTMDALDLRVQLETKIVQERAANAFLILGSLPRPRPEATQPI